MNNEQFSYKDIAKNLLIYVGFILAMKVTVSIAAFALIPYVLFLIAGARKTEIHKGVFWLMTMTAMIYTNSIFFPKNIFYFTSLRILYLLIPFLIFARFSHAKWGRDLQPFMALVLYLLVAVGSSLQGWAPPISLLKIALFSIYMFCFSQLAAVAAAGYVDDAKLRSLVLTLGSFFILGSLVVYPFPSISRSMEVNNMLLYSRYVDYEALKEVTTILYCGIMNHSQTLGPLTACLSALVFSDYIFNVRRRNYLYLLILASAPVVIYLTSGRTAMGTYLFSVAFCLFCVVNARFIHARRRARYLSLSLLGAVVMIAAVFTVPTVRDRVLKYALKYDDTRTTEVTVDTVLSSRQGLIDRAMGNWRESPFLGNGFQVSIFQKGMKIREFRDLLSAPIEKGFMPAMILEETGVVGAIVFSIFFLWVVITWWRRSNFCALTVFLSFVVVNMGEAGIFSPSGYGGLIWTFVFIGLCLDINRRRQQSQYNGYCMFPPRP